MRFVLAVGALSFLGGVVAACVFWAAGGDDAAAFAFALGTFGIALGITVGVSQLDNWGVAGDRPALRRTAAH